MSKSITLVLTLFMVILVAGPGCRKTGKKGSGIFGSDGGSLLNPSDPDGGLLDPALADAGLADPLSRLQEGDYTILTDVNYPPVLFAYDSANLASAERAKVEAVGEFLRNDATTGVIIEGHCDERGSREYNLSLGERRALSVRQYLTGMGIDGSRIQTKSFGEEMPAALGHDEASWRQNRRGEFKLYR